MSADQAAKLGVLLERLAREYPEVKTAAPESLIEPEEPLLWEFVRSMLLWESTLAKAAGAMKRIEAGVVDYNELRVCLPRDLVRLMGETYPAARERADRLHAALGNVFAQRHAVTLRHVQEMSKREARQYLESLEGVPGFVASRLALLHHENHSMPVDSRILRVLVEAKAVGREETCEGAATSVERKVRAGELAGVYLRLQARADELKVEASKPAEPGARPGPKGAGSVKASGRTPRGDARGLGSKAPGA